VVYGVAKRGLAGSNVTFLEMSEGTTWKSSNDADFSNVLPPANY
jgi:hypothetical protein